MVCKSVNPLLANDWIRKDPFFGISFKEEEIHIEFLSKEDLSLLINTEFKVAQHNQVRDIFVFCCWTGLAFADVKALKQEHIVADNDGSLWIRKKREKTAVMCNIPLITPAIRLIEKFKDHPRCISKDVIMPVFSNIYMNDYLRDIAKLCNITKPLTCHMR